MSSEFFLRQSHSGFQYKLFSSYRFYSCMGVACSYQGGKNNVWTRAAEVNLVRKNTVRIYKLDDFHFLLYFWLAQEVFLALLCFAGKLFLAWNKTRMINRRKIYRKYERHLFYVPVMKKVIKSDQLNVRKTDKYIKTHFQFHLKASQLFFYVMF